ncbi:GNAT family N-acetyltransferase [Litorilituus sediminis]|uniref:GNAT family N-acetyltransferase n=1 Tax=Litorilituus sediminis TaxID=718192 RepID=A0A4V0ZFN3_9GAMM|nr:GNAT family N-acyltransferase [Litorilituus sediminis]QBG34400.1 GNAT family N-acetyltransferase [Litorilituus sediminis]
MSYSISRVNWQQAAPLLKNIREKVFICERRIPKKVEFDQHDASAFHMLVCDDTSQEPIATGRISPNGEISRIAVVSSHRAKNIDKVVLHGLFAIAQELSLKEVFILCPLEKVDYFIMHQFQPIGSVYMVAGRPKQRMACSIKTALEHASQAKYYLTH